VKQIEDFVVECRVEAMKRNTEARRCGVKGERSQFVINTLRVQ